MNELIGPFKKIDINIHFYKCIHSIMGLMNYGIQIMQYAKRFMKIVPFHSKADLDLMLIGSAPTDINHVGYIGWWCLQQLDETHKVDVAELLKNDEVREQLEELYYEHQHKVIRPMMRKIIDLCRNDFYQSAITKKLGLDYLEIPEKGNKDYIVYELLERLAHQKIIRPYVHKRKKYFEVLCNKSYAIPTFVVPTNHLSKGIREILQILGTIDIIGKIELEYPGPKLGTKKGRYDIAIYVKQNTHGTPDGLIEYDGEQHHYHIPRWHGRGKKGLKTFLTYHLYDRIKNIYAEKITFLGVLRLSKNHDKKTRIMNWLETINPLLEGYSD